ncbi:MAG: CocE/NonD family hydrolase [Chloroflexota bacterium]
MISQPQYEMRVEKIWITMSDGVRLGATLYLPDARGAQEKFPALLEFLPYRKDDFTAARDVPRYEYFARRGYVGVRADVRGTGASEGVADGEYTIQEGRDALEIIAWLARQPWCNGNVGMWGISYGGFNAIQIAMLRPPALRAIIAVDATDDVYADDINYWGGAMQFEAWGRWPFSMISSVGLPGFPDYDVNSAASIARFESEPWIFQWLREQRDGPFWQRMSLRPRYDAIEIPTLLVGGWLDGYTDSIPRMLEKMHAPTRAIIGPWPHAWPDSADPGPRIDGKYEMLRWWDHWLKGQATGIMDEPRFAIYAQHSYRPSLDVQNIPGAWRYEDGWPLARVRAETWYPQPNDGLAQNLTSDWTGHLPYRATIGTSNRYRVPHNRAELFSDQRGDDAYSLSFTSAPLGHAVEILGLPQAVLHVSASAPIANWIVRVCDVAPDGSSQLVSKGILNGTHRDSHTEPKPMEIDRVYELRIECKFASWVFPVGHRIRLAVGNADFPNLWPSPYAMTTRLFVSQDHPSRIVLPVCAPESRPVPAFRAPEPAAPGHASSAPINEWQITRDEMQKTVTVFRETRAPERQITSGGKPIFAASFERRWCTASDVDPARAKLVAEGEHAIRCGDAQVASRAWLTIESDATAFHVTVKRELVKNDVAVRAKTWQESIPRDQV